MVPCTRLHGSRKRDKGLSRWASGVGATNMFVVFTKEGCTWCDRAKALLVDAGHSFEERRLDGVDQLRQALDKPVSTFPQVLHGDRFVGTFTQLQDYLQEPLLTPATGTRRFTPFPLQHLDLWDMYLKAIASFWTADEISMAEDVTHWRERLNDDERHFIKHVLAFFAGSDGIVMENLQLNFGVEVQAPEARQFYAFQTFNEAEHSRTYGQMIDTLIEEPEERERLFDAIERLPAVRRKATWAMQWLNPTRRFAERLVAWTCVEGIMFSGSFCSIFWLKQRGLMPGLGLSNQFISRDEGLHQEFGAMMYRKLVRTLTDDEVLAIVESAVEAEKEFIVDAIPCRLVGMNSDLMSQYIEFVADRLLLTLGHRARYRATNPFPWMELISLAGKDNFFERFSSEYQKAGVMSSAEGRQFGLDADF